MKRKPSKGSDGDNCSKTTIGVEPYKGGFWSYYQRSAGQLPMTPLHDILKWILQQINLGHFDLKPDASGDIVTIVIGQEAPAAAADLQEAAQDSYKLHLALNIAGLIADAREKGSTPRTLELEERAWSEANENALRRIEIHYGMELCRLLGRISKKLRVLELLPLVDNAPEPTKDYIAEATRCYLLRLDKACIALCRACLEETLKSVLTPEMKNAWREEINRNKSISQSPNPMKALIDVCDRYGILGKHVTDAHYIRDKGNKVLHMQPNLEGDDKDPAGKALQKTRSILRFIYGEK